MPFKIRKQLKIRNCINYQQTIQEDIKINLLKIISNIIALIHTL